MKLKILQKENILDFFTYLFWGIYIITLILDGVGITFLNDTYKMALKVIRYICYFEFAIKTVYDWKKGANITITMIGLTILCTVIAKVSKNTDLIFLVFVLIALRKLDFNKLIKIAFKCIFITFLIIVSLSLFNVIPDWIFKRKEIVRHSLGFIYPTNAIAEYLALIIMFFYIRRDKATIYEIAALETINIFLYKYTDGRTSFILISAVLTLLLISKIKFIKKIFNFKLVKIVLKVMCFCMPLFLFLAIHIVSNMYSPNDTFTSKLNSTLSGRIMYTQRAYKKYNVPVFGKSIEWNGWGGRGYVNSGNDKKFEYNYVDSSYPRMVFDYGIIFSITVLIAYTIVLLKNNKNRNYWTVFSIMIILVWSVIEQHLLRIEKNVFLLAFIPLLDVGKIKFLNYDYIIKGIKHNNKEMNNEKLNS